MPKAKRSTIRRLHTRWQWWVRQQAPGIPDWAWDSLFIGLPRLWESVPVGVCVGLLGLGAMVITVSPQPLSISVRIAVIVGGVLLIGGELAAIARDRARHLLELERSRRRTQRQFDRMMDKFAEIGTHLADYAAAVSEDAALESRGVPATDPKRVQYAESAAASMATLTQVRVPSLPGVISYYDPYRPPEGAEELPQREPRNRRSRRK